MTNPVYQAIIRELETVLPPRVVSRALKDGLKQLGKGAFDVTIPDLETLLHDQVHRQLLGIMSTEKARDAVASMLERLKLLGEGNGPALQPTAEAERAALQELKRDLQPFNLYFEWPEVQKLRAQVQLIATETSAGKPAAASISEAKQQLALVQQKHEDHLVLQAQELAELEAAFEHVSSLGGPRVRRLETLLRQVTLNQKQRTLASAELARARKLATELRKLLESSVYTSRIEEARSDEEAELPDPEEIAARLRQLDIESERHRISQLEQQYANLLLFQPELQATLDGLKEALAAGSSPLETVTAPDVLLDEAASELRSSLAAEVARMTADEAALATPVGTTRLLQALQVAGGILSNTLPDPADMRHVRDLYSLAVEQASLADNAERDLEGEDSDSSVLSDIYMATRQELLTDLYQLEVETRALGSAGTALHEQLLTDLQLAHTSLSAGTELPDLDALHARLDTVRSELSERLSTFPERLAAALETFTKVERLNSDDVISTGRTLRHLDDQKGAFERISPALRIKLEESLQAAEALLVKLEAEFEATRAIADQLVSANILDDLLGLSGPPVPAEPGPELVAFISALTGSAGVTHAALFDDSGLVAGQLSDGEDTPGTSRVLQALVRSCADVAATLGVTPGRLTLELDDALLVLYQPAAGHRLAVRIAIAAEQSDSGQLDAVLTSLEREQQQLAELLGGAA